MLGEQFKVFNTAERVSMLARASEKQLAGRVRRTIFHFMNCHIRPCLTGLAVRVLLRASRIESSVTDGRKGEVKRMISCY